MAFFRATIAIAPESKSVASDKSGSLIVTSSALLLSSLSLLSFAEVVDAAVFVVDVLSVV